LTFFRNFCLKAQTLPRFKFYRSSVLTLIFRKSANRTVPKHQPFLIIFTLRAVAAKNQAVQKVTFSGRQVS
jgi:hypothetical protein